MKKLICVILVVAMLVSMGSIYSFAASADKTATFTLKASVMNASSNGQAQDKKDYLKASGLTVYNSTDGKTINVYPGQVVWVTMHLKTGSKYYAGDLQSYIFYTTNIFKSTDQGEACYIWDTDGKYSGICSTTGAPFSKMVAEAIAETYPAGWSASKRSAHGFYSIIMYPNANATTVVKANVDDDLVTVPIYVKSDAKVGSTGSIFLPEEMIKTVKNPERKFMLSIYSDNGNILGKNISCSNDYGINVSKAKLNFVVCAKSEKTGDVNNDSKINSNDALMVLQSSTGKLTLSSKQTSLADVNKDKKVNSSDALKILQFATGIITKF